MSRPMLALVLALSGALSALGVADSRGWTAPFWAWICPRRTMPSAVERRAAITAARLEAVRREIATVEEERRANSAKREALLLKLGTRLPSGPAAGVGSAAHDALAPGTPDDPVRAVIERSVRATEEAGGTIAVRLGELASRARELEARLEAIRNGVDVTETGPLPLGPVDAMRREGAAAGERRLTILEEDSERGGTPCVPAN